MDNPYTGLKLTKADRYLGEPSDFGYTVCHGCEAGTDMGEWHNSGCSKKCVRYNCGYHFYIEPLVDELSKEGNMESWRELYAARRKDNGKIKQVFDDYDVAREWLEEWQEDGGADVFELVYCQEVVKTTEWELVDRDD